MVSCVKASRVSDHFPFGCPACSKHVKEKSSSISEVKITKQLVEAWFHGIYVRADKNAKDEEIFSLHRRTFLDQHVNAFLRSVGLPTWTARSPLYKDWFLPKVVTMTHDEETNYRAWKFQRRTSTAAYRKRLERLLDS